MTTDISLEKLGYKYFPNWKAWMKPAKDGKGKEEYLFIPGFRVATITDLDIYNLKKGKKNG